MSLWSDGGSPRAGPGASRKGGAHVEALERIRHWTRERFALGEGDTIMVAEVDRTLPGFPPRETQVGFWTADGTRHHFKVFKPVEGVVDEDLPPSWLKDSLALSEGVECACC